MTVKELIGKLSAYDGDELVVVDGCEDGFDDEIRTERVFLVKDMHKRGGVYGAHGRPEHGQDVTVPNDGWNLRAVFIGKGRHLIAGW